MGELPALVALISISSELTISLMTQTICFLISMWSKLKSIIFHFQYKSHRKLPTLNEQMYTIDMGYGAKLKLFKFSRNMIADLLKPPGGYKYIIKLCIRELENTDMQYSIER